MLALADKVLLSDIDKLSKQKLYLPNSVMDLVWMVPNLHTIIKLCFGLYSHSAVFLKGLADHIYENKIMYNTLYTADPFFFAKALYAIDHALQLYWRSCSSSDDHLSINDRVLFMGEVQESVLSFSFARIIPKAISDKIQNYLENKDNNGKNSDGKQRGGNGQGVGKYKNKLHEDEKGKQELNHNTDKNHPNWRMKEGELFYHHQKDCPKTSDGKSICRKFLIRGMCDKACSRAHLLSKRRCKKN